MAGKGLNCSVVLEKCGVKSESIVLFGISDSSLIERPSNHKNINIFYRDGDNRTNFTILERGGRSTHIRDNVSLDCEYKLIEILEYLSKKVEKDDILIISGKIPEFSKRDAVIDFVRACCGVSDKVIIDSQSFSSEEIAEFDIDILKINSDEFSSIFGILLDGNSDCDVIQRYSNNYGISIIVTFGSSGCIAVERGNKPLKVLIGESEKVKGSDAVGSGDSFLAGYIYGLTEGLSFSERLTVATSFGIARQHAEGLESIDLSPVNISSIVEKLIVQNT